MYVVVFAFAMSAVMSAAAAAFCWQQRRATPAASALAMTLSGCAVWSTTDVVAMLGTAHSTQIWATKASFAGIYLGVVGLYRLSSTIVDPHHRRHMGAAVLMTVVPIAAFVAIQLLPVPGPVFRSISDGAAATPPTVIFGPLYWVDTAACYLVLGIALLKLLAARRLAAAVFRSQLSSLVFAALIPIAGNIVMLVGHDSWGHRDVTPLLFTGTALLSSYALLRQGLLRIIPVAREQVLESISDCVLVIDAKGQVVDVNPAARQLIRRLHPGLPADIVGIEAAQLGDFLVDGERACADARTLELLPGYHADVRATILSDRHGRLLGRVIMCHDITDLVVARTELEQQLELVGQLRNELVEQIVRDPLTGLHNRRHLSEALDVALAEADRSSKPVAVLIIDIDHFKEINDRYGHQVGDRALVSLARALAADVRTGDTVARFGGEEFVVVLPGANRAEALCRAEQLRAECTSAVVVAASAEEPADTTVAAAEPKAFVAMTASIGLAIYPDDADTVDSLLASADQALYAAKAGGRNRVVDAATAMATALSAR